MIGGSAFFFSALAILCWGLWPVLDKALLRRMPAGEAFVAQYYVIAVIMAPFMALFWGRCRGYLKSGPTLGLLALSVLAVTLGSYFYFRALALADASRIGPLTAVYPLVSFLLACAWLGESFSGAKLAGTALVVAGTALLAR